jgi:PQQ enzyme repeat
LPAEFGGAFLERVRNPAPGGGIGPSPYSSEGGTLMHLRHVKKLGRNRALSRNCPPWVEELEPRLAPAGNISVLGYHYDNANDGQYQAETALTPANVNSKTFGKLFTTQLDGQVYAEPVYEFGLNIPSGPNKGVHNVVYVATEHDTLYAIDADSGHVLWKDTFINPAGGTNPVPNSEVNGAIGPEVGITGTPVIDPATNTIYVDAVTKEVRGGANHYVDRVWGVQLTDGSRLFHPIIVADTIRNQDGSFTFVSGPTVSGTGAGSVNGKVTFNAFLEMQRPGLTLVNGTVYIGYGSYFDHGTYHGWIIGVNHNSQDKLQVVAAFNATPNGDQGAFWQGGGRIAADSSGNLYAATGNGTFDSTLNPTTHLPVNGDYGDTVLKLAADPTTSATHQNINGWGLKVVDYFTPFNQQTLNNQDLDLGSTAPVLLPASVGAPGHPLLFMGGKEGRIYLIDTTNMGKFHANADAVSDERLIANYTTWGSAAFFNNQLYVVGSGSAAETFSITSTGKFSGPTSQSPDKFGFPGSSPYISANGTQNGVAWDIDTGSGQLRAYNATSYATELYTTNQNSSRDQPGSLPKFAVPTVAHGKVYVGTTADTLVVYGLLPKGAGASMISAPPTTTPSVQTTGDMAQAYGALAIRPTGFAVPSPGLLIARPHANPPGIPVENLSGLPGSSQGAIDNGSALPVSARLHKPSSPTDSFWESFETDI